MFMATYLFAAFNATLARLPVSAACARSNWVQSHASTMQGEKG